METKRLQELQREVRAESPEEAKRRGLQISAELNMLEAMYEEFRLKGRIEREEGVELEREWAI